MRPNFLAGAYCASNSARLQYFIADAAVYISHTQGFQFGSFMEAMFRSTALKSQLFSCIGSSSAFASDLYVLRVVVKCS